MHSTGPTFHLSYWERRTYFEGLDLVIVGAGIVGLSAALEMHALRPDWRILVVDRGGFLPYGASTRNAGFACFGSVSELLDDQDRMPVSEVFDLVERRWRGLQKLRQRLGDASIDYEPLGGYELFTPAQRTLYSDCRDWLPALNTEMRRITGMDVVYSTADGRIKDFGFGGAEHLLLNSGEGQLDAGKMMQALLARVRAAGVEVLSGIGITHWENNANGVQVHTQFGFSFVAGTMLVTTNAFARQLLPDLPVEPGRAQVLLTAPVPQLSVRGSFHYDKGYYYFRNVGDRILFGGGRNLDFDTERTEEFGLTPLVQDRLENLLGEVILPGKEVRIDMRWSGIMGLGATRRTIVQQVQERIYCAVRMGGMGVAIGSLVGEEVAALIHADS